MKANDRSNSVAATLFNLSLA